MTSPISNPIPNGTKFSIAIPWLELVDKASGCKIDAAYVQRVFDGLDMGEISKIDLIYRHEIPASEDQCFKRAHQKGFVHFSNLTETGEKVLEHLSAPTGAGRKPNEIKVWYSPYYYWKARKSTFEFKSGGSPTEFTPRVEF